MRLYLLGLLLLTSCQTHCPDDDLVWHDTLPTSPKEELSQPASMVSSHATYLIKTGQTKLAIDELLQARQSDPYVFHEGCLESLGLALLEQGSESSDIQDLYTSLYGAGISHDERTLVIAEKALHYEDPQIQLLAVSVVGSFDTELAIKLLEKAMKSNYLFVRLEAAYWLAQKHAKSAFGQLIALLSKVDPQLHELFPRLFAIEGGANATKELKRLLFDKNEAVRRETILAIADFQRDDFVEEIRLLANEPSNVQQEACAYALGQLGDECSREKLTLLTASSCPTTSLAAYQALTLLGEQTAKRAIAQRAATGDPFAIALLGSIDADDNLLAQLLESPDSSIRTNATIALLERRDKRCLDRLLDILIDSHTDYTYQKIFSHGGALSAWKATPSSSLQLQKEPQLFELSLRLREQALTLSLELAEEDFLTIARSIFACGQFDLIPLTVRLLENLQSDGAIALLKEQEQRPGVPFIRAWSCLALYRLHQVGPYADTIRKLVEKNETIEVFKARPILPWRMRQEDSTYKLTLAESCALLIESYEALAQSQDEKGIEALLKTIRDGNEHNRYTLAGLLLRAIL